MNKFLILTIITIIINITSINASKSPPKIEQNPLSLIVNVSDPVTLQCGATGDPKPKITWYRDGHQLNIVSKSESTIMNTGVNNKYTLIHDSNLFIISAALGKGNKSDTGVYYCKAQNEHGEAISSNASLIITYLKDDFREIPKSRQVNAGSQVIMECKAPRGFPEPIIWWEKNNVQLYQSKDVYVFSNGTFVIVNASIKDNGEYVCVARNEAGIKRSQPAFLNVFEKPWFTVQPETAKYQTNTKVELECQANGFPKPVIEWKKDNSIDNLPLKSQIRDNILIIPNIQLEDEGEYTCVASNQLATIEAKSYLIVYEKPTFTKTMPNVTVGFESKSITIECNARGKPQPVIYWAKSTQMASSASSSSNLVAEKRQGNADDFIILENGNLFIERLSKKYEGTYLCQASNEYGNTETKTYLQVKSIQSKPPPIVIYGPQNQTIPINTQATLECLTTIASNTLINNNLNMANSQQQQQQQYELNEKIVVTWFKGTKQINDIPNFETTKYRVLDTGSLEINSVQKSDSGLYKCVATNIYGQTRSIGAYLNIENPNNQFVEFQRNYETTALPSAPTQPVVISTGSTSVSLTWQASSHSGHSPLKSYTIEYYSPEWPKSLPGWHILAENIPAVNSFIVENLQPDTYYMFMVRAKNEQGYGPPSQASDLVKTLVETQSLFRNKNTNEILEKALTGEVIQLNDPAEVLSSTSINVTWKILKSANLIEGFYLKYKPIGSKDYKVETISDAITKQHHYVLHNLHKFTPYEILMEPFSGSISGSESNIVQVKTLDDVPSQSPINLNVELDSLTSMSIKWQPPPLNHMNGVINGYKISCIANETKYSLNLNTNATTRAIILGNLIEGMKYCVKVAAFTKKGTGPYTTPKCIEMSTSNLIKSQTSSTIYTTQSNIQSVSNFKSLTNESWFITLLVLCSILILSLVFYCVWLLFKRSLIMKKKKCKYMSTSSETGSLNVPHKIDNGNRYKLVNDTIWLDTLHSNSNQSSSNVPECCCVPDLHHQIFLQQNNLNNVHLIHDLNCQSVAEHNHKQQRLNNHSIKSKFAPINKLTDNSNNNSNNNNLLTNTTTTTTTTSSSAPQYAEIYGPNLQQLQQQLQSANPYATTGLFINNNNNNNLDDSDLNNSNPYNIINYQTLNNNNFRNIPNIIDSNGNLKYSSYTIKMLADKMMMTNQTDNDLANNQSTLLADQKKLLKYLQATQSQSNTPRVQIKNIKNRVNSDHVNQCLFNQQQQPPPPPPPLMPINQHQLISYLSENNNETITTEAIRNFLDMLPQQQQIQNNQPSLPAAPPPSLASALIAQQHKQQQQLIEGYNNFVANTISRNNPQSPVHYNSPWNVNLEGNQSNQNSFLVNRIISHNNNNSNSSSIVSNLTGNTTLSRGLTRNSPLRNSNNNQNISSTFTAQQYANRTIKSQQLQMQLQLHQQQQHQVQQDYSSISPEDDLKDFKFNEYQQQQHQQQQQQQLRNQSGNHTHGMIQSWASVAETASSNPISSSFDSTNNQNCLSTSSNSSDLSSKRSSRSDEDMNNSSKQTTLNDDDYDNKTNNNKFIPIKQTVLETSINKHYLINNNDQNDDIYLSEMPQTIL